jgi:hypothetical protein
MRNSFKNNKQNGCLFDNNYCAGDEDDNLKFDAISNYLPKFNQTIDDCDDGYVKEISDIIECNKMQNSFKINKRKGCLFDNNYCADDEDDNLETE